MTRQTRDIDGGSEGFFYQRVGERFSSRANMAHVRYFSPLLSGSLNALDADRDLFNAELSLTKTERNELLALVQLYKALGGGWQP